MAVLSALRFRRLLFTGVLCVACAKCGSRCLLSRTAGVSNTPAQWGWAVAGSDRAGSALGVLARRGVLMVSVGVTGVGQAGVAPADLVACGLAGRPARASRARPEPGPDPCSQHCLLDSLWLLPGRLFCCGRQATPHTLPACTRGSTARRGRERRVRVALGRCAGNTVTSPGRSRSILRTRPHDSVPRGLGPHWPA